MQASSLSALDLVTTGVSAIGAEEDVGDARKRSAKLGYEGTELEEGADLGLGCGNPLIAARLQEGEVVLDLGSGAGVDCFAAAKQVEPQGRVIGVDMTPEMLARARQTALDCFC